MQILKNIFRYGSVGSALDGFRDSEIAEQSAHTIKDFYISEMGTLRVAKKYTPQDLTVNVIKFKDTKYSFFIGITSTEIITFNKQTRVIVQRIAHGLTIPDHTFNLNIFNDFLFIQGSNGVKVFGINKDGNIGTTNFFETIKLPFQNKQTVKIDYYKVFEITLVDKKELRPELMTSFDDNLELEVKDGHVYIKNLGIKIDRIYKQYKAALSKDDVTGIAVGQTYLVFRNYKVEDEGATYYFGNTKVTFTGSTSDSKYGSEYFTGASPNGANGNIVYGVLEDFLPKIRDIAEFQSRLVVASDEKVYFSKTLDYNNFVPGLNSEDGFFIKPSPIDGNQPNVLKITTGTGLYLTCEKGIVVIGYGSHLTPATSMSSVRIAGNSPATKVNALVEDDFYYIDAMGQLRCILLNVDGGVIQFTNNIAEKYSFSRGKIKNLSFGVVNEDNVLIATMIGNSEVKIYNRVEDNLFRNFSITFDTTYPVWGYNENMIAGDKFYTLTQNNVPKASLVLNMPQVVLKGKGAYLNDFELAYDRMVLNILNEDKAIKGVTILTRDLPPKPIQNLSIVEGNYNIYDLMSSVSIINPEIEIFTNETDKVIELRGVNLLIGGG